MKTAGKILTYLFLSVFLIIILLMIVAEVAQEKIVKLALEQVSKSTNIPIQVDKIEFSLIRNFPLATLKCEDLLVQAPKTDGTPGDTLLRVGTLSISVEAKPLLDEVFKIKEVEIGNASVYYRVDTAGVSNYDFLTDTTATAIDTVHNNIYLNIEDFNLKDVRCYYADQKRKAGAELLLKKVALSGLMDNHHYAGRIKGEAQLSRCLFDSTNVQLMKQADLAFNLDYRDGLLVINDAGVAIDGEANLQVTGSVNLADSLKSDLNVKARGCRLDELVKYAPTNYLARLGVATVGGQVDLDATVAGALGDSVLPRTNLKVALTDGKLTYGSYPALHHIGLVAHFSNGEKATNAGSSLRIESFNCQTGRSKASLSGSVKNLDRPDYDFVSILKLDLEELAPYVPDTLVKDLGGTVDAVISTRGTYTGSFGADWVNTVLAHTSFKLNAEQVSLRMDSLVNLRGLSGQFDYKPGLIKLSQLALQLPDYRLTLRNCNAETTVKGDFTKPESLEFAIARLSAATDSSLMQLSGELRNPMSPDYALSGQLDLNLGELKRFVPAGLVTAMDGNVLVNFSSKAKLNFETLADEAMAVAFEKSRFKLAMRDVTVLMPDTATTIRNLSGRLTYETDSLWIDGLRGHYLNVRFGADSTSVKRVYSAAIQNKPKELTVHGNFSVDALDYALIEKLMDRFMPDESPTGPAADDDAMRFTYKINGNVRANRLLYEGNVFRNAVSKFLVRDSHYVFDDLHLEGFDGSSVSSVKVDFVANDQLELYFKTNVKGMDVNKLISGFRQYIEMDDFKAENVRGKVSTQMDGKIVLDKDYNPVYNSLMLKGDLVLENGALLNVKPVMEVEKIPGVGLKHMDKLYFSTLKSSIFLFNNKLYIPKTEIRSSSFDAMFLGMWSFGEDYAYHIRMFLGEVISSKSKSNLKKQMQEGGFEEDHEDATKGRSSIYLVSKKEDGKEKAWFDNKKDRANMAARVNLQEQMVNMNFHPMLVKYNTEN